jgi:ethanolamine kinase
MQTPVISAAVRVSNTLFDFLAAASSFKPNTNPTTTPRTTSVIRPCLTLFAGAICFGLSTVRARHRRFQSSLENQSCSHCSSCVTLDIDTESDCDSQKVPSMTSPNANNSAETAATTNNTTGVDHHKTTSSVSSPSAALPPSPASPRAHIRVAPTCDIEVALTDEQQRADGICQVCRQLVKGWSADPDTHFSIRTISGGITNLLFAVSNRGETVLVRIFGANTDVMIDRIAEAKVFAVLSDNGFGPFLHGSFGNGRIEGFFANAPNLEPNQMGERSPIDYPSLIAVQLARMHSLDMPLEHEPSLWPVLTKWAKMAGRVSLAAGSTKAQTLEHIDVPKCQRLLAWAMQELPSEQNNHGMDLLAAVTQEHGQGSPEASAMRLLFQSVFAHNDLLSGNVLSLAESEKRVQFIDFEYGAYNYLGFDIANHFCEYAGFDFNLSRWYPSNDAKTHFMKSYVASVVAQNSELASVLPAYVVKRCDGNNNNSGSGSESSSECTSKDQEDYVLFFRALCKWLDRFALASHLYWGFWAIVQEEHSPIDFDFIGYGKLRFEGFQQHQREFFPSTTTAGAGTASLT